MGRSVLLEVIDRPATSVIICTCVAVWLKIHSAGLTYGDVGVSFDNAIWRLQLWRLLTAQLSHVSGLHLLFNVSALWNIGMIEHGQHAGGSGTVFYISNTFLFFVMTAVAFTSCYAISVMLFKREQDAHVVTVGYSGIIFAWMSYMATATGVDSYSMFGLSVPAHLMPWAALGITSIIIPNASFLGHLAGILSGYLVAFLPAIPLWGSAIVFGLFLAGVGWSLWHQFGWPPTITGWQPLAQRTQSDDVELG